MFLVLSDLWHNYILCDQQPMTQSYFLWPATPDTIMFFCGQRPLTQCFWWPVTSDTIMFFFKTSDPWHNHVLVTSDLWHNHVFCVTSNPWHNHVFGVTSEPWHNHVFDNQWPLTQSCFQWSATPPIQLFLFSILSWKFSIQKLISGTCHIPSDSDSYNKWYHAHRSARKQQAYVWEQNWGSVHSHHQNGWKIG